MHELRTGQSKAKPKIIYIQYTNPTAYPPLQNSARIFASLGWEVLFLGIHAEGNADRLEACALGSVRLKLLARWQSRLFLKLHFLWFVAWCSWRLVFERPTVVYLSDTFACPLGLILASTTRIPIVYHEHDSPQPSSKGIIQSLLLWAREKVAARCRLCILPNASRAQAFSLAIPSARRVISVMNCPAVSECDKPREWRAISQELRLYYHGSLVPARLPTTILDALCDVPSTVNLLIAGYFASDNLDYVSYFAQQAQDRGLQFRVHFQGLVPSRDALLRGCAAHDVGLALLPIQTSDANQQMMAGASNKIFEYMARGLAVLVPDLPDHRRLFVDSGVAICCNPHDPASIASAFRWFLTHPQETREMGERGRQKISQDWNYEVQFQPVVSELKKNSKITEVHAG